MVLLDLMHEASRYLTLKLGVFHADHGLRAGESEQDAIFVNEACRRLSLPFHMARLNMTPGIPNVEEEARTRRYAAIRECMNGYDYSHAAIGHTMDDQAETVVYRIIRGTGIRGLAGMDYRNADGFIRPMLEIPKFLVEEHARIRHIEYVNDRTNEDTRLARNLIRKELIPAMERINPHAVRCISSLAHIARDEGSIIERMALELERNSRVSDWEIFKSYKASELKRARPALVKRVLIHVISELIDEPRGIDALQVEAALDVLEQKTRAHTIKRKLRIILDKDQLVFHKFAQGPFYSIEVRQGGTFFIAQIKKTLRVTIPPYAEKPLFIRSYMRGDRLNGRKVADILTCMQVPYSLKTFWPVLATKDAVVAVASETNAASDYKVIMEGSHG